MPNRITGRLNRATILHMVVCFIASGWGLTLLAVEWEGALSDYHSYDQYNFEVNKLNCKVVLPKEVAEGRPWIWRARFFGPEPQTELALLEKGYHVAYVDVADLFGSSLAVERWSQFYRYLVEEHGFAKQVVLEGFSRGGLIVYNWAAKNPEKVACIYADAPVCDFKSWPMRYSSEATWQKCLDAYGLTEEEALNYDKNPIDNLGPLAKAGIPLLHVVGDADLVVPVSENTALIESRYKALGGRIEVIHKPGIGHHPHSLKDPTPIVEFVLKNAK